MTRTIDLETRNAAFLGIMRFLAGNVPTDEPTPQVDVLPLSEWVFLAERAAEVIALVAARDHAQETTAMETVLDEAIEMWRGKGIDLQLDDDHIPFVIQLVMEATSALAVAEREAPAHIH